MTRKEEINVAASKYIEDNSMPDGYIAISDHKDSFIEGANWADSHPVNVWHSADEVPPKDTNILIETSFFGEDSLEYYSYYWCYPAVPGWVEYVKEYHVKRWAYISDLLQKKIKI